jgi:hypothetical protein
LTPGFGGSDANSIPEVWYETGVAISLPVTLLSFFFASLRPRRLPAREGVVVSPTIIKEVAP